MSAPLFMVFSIIWPLMLAAAMTQTTLRRIALHFAPWAALPALIIALGIDDGTLHIPGTMLNAVLRLDNTGRPFLILLSVLSLAAGLLVAERSVKSLFGPRFVFFLMLAISGTTGLALAGDALIFLTFGTLLGYSIYGMLVTASPVAVGAARVFVVFLVVSDLALFELLLVLAHDAGGISFDTLRHSLLLEEIPGAVLFLLIFSTGSKLGLIGFHFWLAPVFVHAAAPVRPMLIGFILCAGILGWIRLLPFGEIYWPEAGQFLRWLAVASLAYAFVAGILQAQVRSLLAYAVMVLTALILWSLGVTLETPTLWPEIIATLHVAMMQAGYALALLFLLPGQLETSVPAWQRHGIIMSGWFAVVLLVLSPVGVIVALASNAPAKAIILIGMGAAVALLAGRSLRLQNIMQITAVKMLVVAGLGVSTLLVASYHYRIIPDEDWQSPALYLVFAILAGWSGAGVLTRRLPKLPPGDLLIPIERGLYVLIHRFYLWADTRLPHFRKGILNKLKQLSAIIAWREHAGKLEGVLSRWSIAMIMLTLLGLSVGWWLSIN